MKRYLLPLVAAVLALLALGLTFSRASGQEVRFYSSATCAPCQLAKPKMQQLASEGIAIRFIDVASGAPAHITRVPAYEYVDASGRVVERWEGAAPVAAIRRLWSGQRNSKPAPILKDSSVASRVCRIRVEYKGGQYKQGYYYGTGCYVTNGEETYIQSCAHNFEPGPGETIVGISAHFPGSINVRCELVSADKRADLARLQPESQLPITPLVATGEMEHGSSVSWYGYGKSWSLRTGSGQADTSQLVNGYGNIIPRTGPRVVQGDSGGPIVNSKGEVVGVLFGVSEENGQVYLTCRKTFRSFFGIERSVARQPIRRQPQPTAAPPRQQNTPPGDCGCRDNFAQVHAELANCIQRIERMEKLAGEARGISADWEAEIVARLESKIDKRMGQMTCEPGPAGPPGPQGPRGEPGKDGKDADNTALVARINQLEADLKKEQERKIKLELYRKNGTELIGVSEGRSILRVNVDELE